MGVMGVAWAGYWGLGQPFTARSRPAGSHLLPPLGKGTEAGWRGRSLAWESRPAQPGRLSPNARMGCRPVARRARRREAIQGPPIAFSRASVGEVRPSVSSSCSPSFPRWKFPSVLSPSHRGPALAVTALEASPSAHPSVHPTIVRPSLQPTPPPGFPLLHPPDPELLLHKVGPRPSCRRLPRQRSRQIDVISVGLASPQPVNLACLRRTRAPGAGYRRAPRGTCPPGRQVPAPHDVRSPPRAHRHLHHLRPRPCHRPAVNRAPPCATRRCRGWASEK